MIICCTETVAPPSDHYGTTKVAPSSDHLHTKSTYQHKLIGEKNIHQKVGWGGGRGVAPLATPILVARDCEGLSMPSLCLPVLCCPLPDLLRVAPVDLSLHGSAGLHCRLFLSYGLQVVSREVHRSSFEAVDLPCTGPLHFFLTFLIMSTTFVLSLTHVYAVTLYDLLSIEVSLLLSIFYLGGRKFVLCLFGECPAVDSRGISDFWNISCSGHLQSFRHIAKQA